MSWVTGSTPEWRRNRLLVLNRDGWTCTICATPIHPKCNPEGCGQCAHVHHTQGHGGNPQTANPLTLAAACRDCNLKAGQPPTTLRTSRKW